MFCKRTCIFFVLILTQLCAVTVAAKPDANQPPRERPDSEIGTLLNELEAQNKGPDLFNDPWLETLKLISDLDDEATPELVKELDHTTDDRMLRCMGFIMRARGDKRAVPALIRAIPKTLLKPGSDMGLRVEDDELEKFAQEFDLDDRTVPGEYGFGRPVREIFGALQELTGEDFEDDQLYSIFRYGNKRQISMKSDIFHRQAAKWATWWEASAEKFDVDEEYRLVKLPAHKPTEPAEPAADVPYKSDSGSSNWMMNSLQTADSRTVFFDFDTTRRGKLPKKWRLKENLKPGEYPAPLREIFAWAAAEGYDMMGEELPLKDGETVYAIRLIDMQARQLPMRHWRKNYDKILLKDLIGSGVPHKGDHLFRNNDGETDHFGHAPFVIVTREGTPGILSLGIEVRDDSLKPGGRGPEDAELSPIAFTKGRRFAFKILVPEREP